MDAIDSYGEVSPSGKGIRLITTGAIPEGIKNRRNDIPGAKGIEVYESGRYLTMTGQALFGKPKPVKKLGDDFWSFYQQLGNRTTHSSTTSGQHCVILTDHDQWVIDKLLNDSEHGPEFRRLHLYGDISSFEGDRSRADLKLVGYISYYAGYDEQQIDRIFRSSKLMRPKWDKSHRTDGASYGQMTIEKALDGRFIRHKSETESFLNYHYDFHYNEVLDRKEYRKRGEQQWTLVGRREFASVLRHIKTSKGTCGEAYLHVILDSDFCPLFNPFVEYFTSLPAISGTEELQKLMDTVTTTDQDYWEWTFKRWLIALIACATNDASINHQVLVFQGKQGAGKSTWLRKLLPPSLEHYTYPGELNPSDKDTMVYLSECLVINLDELASLNRGKESALKEVITKGGIKVRKAYRRNPEDLVRRASFTGSTNSPQILMDTTGSRRYLIHEVTDIDYHTDIDIDKVMAEAYTLYKSGEKYWFDGADIDRINQHNNQFKQVSALEEILLRNYEPAGSSTPVRMVQHMSSTELMNHMMERKLLPKAASASYLGKLLQAHGFQHKNHSGVQVYAIVPRNKMQETRQELFETKSNN